MPELRHQAVVEGEGGAEGEQEKRSSMPKVYRAPEVRDLPPDQPSASTSADVYRSASTYTHAVLGVDYITCYAAMLSFSLR